MENKTEKYDINHRWVDTAENVWTVSPSMKVSIEMADYKKDGDYTWSVDGDDVPCEFMELMLIPPKDSRFYKHLLEPDEGLLARVWFEPSTASPILDELVKKDPNMFHIEDPYRRAEGYRKFEALNETVEFTEDEFNGIIDFARKTREFHAALGIKEYVGESVVEEILDEHILSSEEPEDTKRFADWVNNEFGAEVLSQKNAEKILEYHAESGFNILIGSDGKLYEYDPQEGFLDGFSEQSFENIIENTMGMIEQNGEIERENDDMRAVLKKDLKEMETVAKKMIDAKEKKKSRDELPIGMKKTKTQSKEILERHDRAMQNLRIALSGIKNGYNDSLDDYEENVYARKGAWSVSQKTEKQESELEIKYENDIVMSVKDGFASGILKDDIITEIEKIRPDFKLGLTKPEKELLEGKVFKERLTQYSITEQGKVFDINRGCYLNSEKLSSLLHENAKELSYTPKEKTVFDRLMEKLEETDVSIEGRKNEVLVKDLHDALEGLANGYNNNLDEYVANKHVKKGDWEISGENDNFTVRYGGKCVFDINVSEDGGLELYGDAMEILSKGNVEFEKVFQEVEKIYPEFNLELTSEEKENIKTLLDNTRMHTYLELDENGRVFETEDEYYPSKKELGNLLLAGIENDKTNFTALNETQKKMIERLTGNVVDKKFPEQKKLLDDESFSASSVPYRDIIKIQDFFGIERLDNEGEMAKGFTDKEIKLAESDVKEFYDDSLAAETGYSKEQYFLQSLTGIALNERYADYPGWREMAEHNFPERFPKSQDEMALDVIETLGLGLDGENKVEARLDKMKYISNLDKTIDGMTNFIGLHEILLDDIKSDLESQSIVEGLDGDWCFYDMSDSKRTLNFGRTHVLEMDRNTKDVFFDIKAWNLIEDRTGLKMEEILGEAERIYSQDKSLGLKFPSLSDKEKTIDKYTTQELWNEINNRDDFLGGKIWVKDDIKNYLEIHKDSFARFGEIKNDEDTIKKIATNINTDALSDCTDAEWDAIHDACKETFEKQKLVDSINKNAVSIDHGIDLKGLKKEPQIIKEHLKENDSGIER